MMFFPPPGPTGYSTCLGTNTVVQFITENLPIPLLTMCIYNYEVHRHYTRISSRVRPVRVRLNVVNKSSLNVGPTL